MQADLCATFVCSQLEDVFSLYEISLAMIVNKKGKVISLTHQIFVIHSCHLCWVTPQAAPGPTGLWHFTKLSPCPCTILDLCARNGGILSAKKF